MDITSQRQILLCVGALRTDKDLARQHQQLNEVFSSVDTEDTVTNALEMIDLHEKSIVTDPKEKKELYQGDHAFHLKFSKN